MPDRSISRALLSVSDKTDLVPFARALEQMGVQIISTGGTAAALREAGVNVVGVGDVTGFPEIMDGRVKTLHPLIHGALLGRRDDTGHMEAMDAHGIVPIDLVCVNLYPFEQTIKKEGIEDDEAIEQIDIGGPSMLRSAAKNHQFVTVVTSSDQYDHVINQMQANDGCTSEELRRELAAAAFSRTAEYDATISAWMGHRQSKPFPNTLRLSYIAQSDLRYGENPQQKATLYRDPDSTIPSVVTSNLLAGKQLSYNNILDASAALEAVADLRDLYPDKAGVVIVKHTNPCGASVDASPTEAFNRSWSGDPLAAFGGIIAFNTTVDAKTAGTMIQGDRFIEVILAEDFDEEAVSLITDKWKNARILKVGSMQAAQQRQLSYRTVPGGLLAQENDWMPIDQDQFIHAAGPAPDQDMISNAAFSYTVVKHLKSNAVCLCSDHALRGAGCGTVDRVSACRQAIEKTVAGADGQAGNLVAASDAFFPFPDGPELLVKAGARCIIHPGGSKRDDLTFDLCNREGVTCLTTGVRHFRH
ncbi:MAG: bifunctional phosphoribosylaminoimidazolecarboxamide formyltransferase/inosine monophosphate cyclohydrolase [Phycisphaerae bacterium]|nr:bifunctional phosphoribosylaminoimidazolecarboxamide formyltransferase/inosine monophosphate cyclohydrolase [Phycisphaerae bacterium]